MFPTHLSDWKGVMAERDDVGRHIIAGGGSRFSGFLTGGTCLKLKKKPCQNFMSLFTVWWQFEWHFQRNMTQVSRAIRTSRSNAQAMALAFRSSIFATAPPTVPTGKLATTFQIVILIWFLDYFSREILDTTKISASALQVSPICNPSPSKLTGHLGNVGTSDTNLTTWRRSHRRTFRERVGVGQLWDLSTQIKPRLTRQRGQHQFAFILPFVTRFLKGEWEEELRMDKVFGGEAVTNFSTDFSQPARFNSKVIVKLLG
jgi:hypothetical protein